MLGEVVVDAEHGAAGVVLRGRLAVAAVELEVLSDRAAAVGRQVLQRRGRGGRRRNDDRVAQRALLFQDLHDLGDGRLLLADRHVDADDILALLVDDRVEGDGRLAGLAIADDQLALAATDRCHGVDRLEAGLHRLVHGAAVDDAGSDPLHVHGRVGLDRSLAVERQAQGIDHPPEHLVPGGDLHDAAGAANAIAFLDQRGLAEQHGADVVLLEVQRHAHHVVGQLEQLARHDLVQAVDAADPVADRDHGADLGQVGGPVVVLDLGPDQLADFIDLELHGYSWVILRRSWLSWVLRLPS